MSLDIAPDSSGKRVFKVEELEFDSSSPPINSSAAPTTSSARIRLPGFSLPLFGAQSHPEQHPLVQQQNADPLPHKRRISAGWLKKSHHSAAVAVSAAAAVSPGDRPNKDAEKRHSVAEAQGVSNVVESEENAEHPDHAAIESQKISSDPGDVNVMTEKFGTIDAKPAQQHVDVPAPTHVRTASAATEPGFDLEDLHRTQKRLVRLRDDFNSGKLKVFESTDAVDRMKKVRERQEKLAKLHFDLHAVYSTTDMHTSSARTTSLSSLKLLMEELQILKTAVQGICIEADPSNQFLS